jgi:hypothetical protein
MTLSSSLISQVHTICVALTFHTPVALISYSRFRGVLMLMRACYVCRSRRNLTVLHDEAVYHHGSQLDLTSPINGCPPILPPHLCEGRFGTA